jgi:hypothetical protein
VNKTITVSITSSNNIVLDAGKKDRFFAVAGGFLLKNLILKNAANNGQFSVTAAGGAIAVNKGAQATFDACSFVTNSGDGPSNGRGAIYVAQGAKALFTGCNFTSNSWDSSYGGGGAVSIAGDSTFNSCDFNNNQCFSGGGGAISIMEAGAAVTTNKSNFTNNYATGGGGAIALMATGSTMNAFACDFIFNHAEGNEQAYDGAGGAVCIIAANAVAALTQCSFSHNSVSGFGGAVYFKNANAVLTTCSFSSNNATNGGGPPGYGRGGAVYAATSTGLLENCIFSGNTVPESSRGGPGGGALYFDPDSTGLLKNCSLLGTASPNNYDIVRAATTANVTFACADGEVGTPVQMSGTEITKIPALTCTTSYSCDSPTGICKSDKSGAFPSKQACSSGCTAQPTPAPCQVPRNCGQHNNSVVCGHIFTGCEFVCGKGSDPLPVGCCHASTHADEICNGCVQDLCKPVPPLPPPVTTKYACVTMPNYHCVESSGGFYPLAKDCENACPPPGLSP